jgi:hypothetical protein
MLPSEYDLRVVEQRYHELRREASAYRQAKAVHVAHATGLSIVARIRSLADGSRARTHAAPIA